jgi:alpha-tubulin suppressor-like RCC1 family protein
MKSPSHSRCLLVATAVLVACGGADRAAIDSTLPTDAGEQVVAATVGKDHACAISSAGRAYCWGIADPWLLGGDVDSVTPGTPMRVGGDHRFKSIAAGETFTCAVAADGQAFCWGKGDNGELGGGKLYDQSRVPRRVSGDTRFTSVVAGRQHACALDAEGGAWCWGNNEVGQIADGTKTKYAQRPVRVAGRYRFKQLGAGGGSSTTCGVTLEGNGVCWGSNTSGQLGIGSTRASGEPVQVPSLSSLRDISAGPDASCAVTGDGGVYCWGSNRFGQLGIGAMEATIPQPSGRVQTYERFSAVVAGPGKACALATTGQAYCWGSNADELLNAASTDVCTERSLPCARLPQRVPASVFRQLSIGSTGQVCGAGRFELDPLICWGRSITPPHPSAGVVMTGPPAARTIHLWAPDPTLEQRGSGTGATSSAEHSGFEALTLTEKMMRSPLDSVPRDASTLLHSLLPDFVAFYPEHYQERERNSYPWSPNDGLSIIRANLSGAGLTDFVIAGRDTKTQLIVALMRDTAQRSWSIKTVSYGIGGGSALSPRVTLQRGAGLHPDGLWDAVLVRRTDAEPSSSIERFYWDARERRFYLLEPQPSR